MICMLFRTRILIATLWAGSVWTIGYLAAPTLFATLSDRVLAGTIAGSLFRVEAWLSMFCAAALIIMIGAAKDGGHTRQRDILLAIVIAILLCTLLTHFGLQPAMAALREAAGPAGVMVSDAKLKFGILHGVSAAIYLIQSVLAAVLILRIR